MAETSTRVFIYEAMGRDAGWLAAAAGLAGNGDDEAPHIILLPERAYDEALFLAKVKAVVERVGYCVVVASEGIATADGRFVADAGGGKDSFGHSQLGGVAAHLAGRVKDQLGLKQDRLGAGAGGGQGCGAVGAEGPERRDAGDRAQQRRAVPLED
ncbi:hypothetical protein G6F63_015003 [Rhizopus arrhizus]|nr:hypothetical protein G6F63_015003 [Rhizopus arrhizus]